MTNEAGLEFDLSGWISNQGYMPHYQGEVMVILESGAIFSTQTHLVRWNNAGFLNDIKKWRKANDQQFISRVFQIG